MAAMCTDGGSCFEMVDSVIKNKKNSNRIIDLEKLLLSEDQNEVVAAMESSTKLFCYFVQNGNINPSVTAAAINGGEADEKYNSWLKERYGEIKSLLCDHLQHSCKDLQGSSLFALMRFVKVEGENPLKIVPDDTWYFPKETFQHVIECMTCDDKDMEHLIKSFGHYTKYSDVKLYVLKAIWTVLENIKQQPSSVFLYNVFYLLSQIHFPREFSNDNASDIQGGTFVEQKDSCPVFKLKCAVFRRMFSSVWIKFLSFKLPSSLYKNVLILLRQDVLPHLKNPLLLTDFLTDSYNLGGAVSLLALNGLFFLIQEYNLEYPNFYQKLYALFQPDIITSKYRARFFFLADLFLTSTHLPSYLVAAFIKRLGRLALAAPPHVLLIIIPFIRNLLIRHPSLRTLMHCPGKMDIMSDPYNAETTDPAKCNAIDSSLWEIKSLQNHWHPAVSKKANFLNSAPPQMEWNISGILEMDIDDLIEKESGLTCENAPMSFDKPLGLFERHEDKMHDLWTL